MTSDHHVMYSSYSCRRRAPSCELLKVCTPTVLLHPVLLFWCFVFTCSWNEIRMRERYLLMVWGGRVNEPTLPTHPRAHSKEEEAALSWREAVIRQLKLRDKSTLTSATLQDFLNLYGDTIPEGFQNDVRRQMEEWSSEISPEEHKGRILATLEEFPEDGEIENQNQKEILHLHASGIPATPRKTPSDATATKKNMRRQHRRHPSTISVKQVQPTEVTSVGCLQNYIRMLHMYARKPNVTVAQVHRGFVALCLRMTTQQISRVVDTMNEISNVFQLSKDEQQSPLSEPSNPMCPAPPMTQKLALIYVLEFALGEAVVNDPLIPDTWGKLYQKHIQLLQWRFSTPKSNEIPRDTLSRLLWYVLPLTSSMLQQHRNMLLQSVFLPKNQKKTKPLDELSSIASQMIVTILDILAQSAQQTMIQQRLSVERRDQSDVWRDLFLQHSILLSDAVQYSLKERAEREQHHKWKISEGESELKDDNKAKISSQDLLSMPQFMDYFMLLTRGMTCTESNDVVALLSECEEESRHHSAASALQSMSTLRFVVETMVDRLSNFDEYIRWLAQGRPVNLRTSVTARNGRDPKNALLSGEMVINAQRSRADSLHKFRITRELELSLKAAWLQKVHFPTLMRRKSTGVPTSTPHEVLTEHLLNHILEKLVPLMDGSGINELIEAVLLTSDAHSSSNAKAIQTLQLELSTSIVRISHHALVAWLSDRVQPKLTRLETRLLSRDAPHRASEILESLKILLEMRAPRREFILAARRIVPFLRPSQRERLLILFQSSVSDENFDHSDPCQAFLAVLQTVLEPLSPSIESTSIPHEEVNSEPTSQDIESVLNLRMVVERVIWLQALRQRDISNTYAAFVICVMSISIAPKMVYSVKDLFASRGDAVEQADERAVIFLKQAWKSWSWTTSTIQREKAFMKVVMQDILPHLIASLSLPQNLNITHSTTTQEKLPYLYTSMLLQYIANGLLHVLRQMTSDCGSPTSNVPETSRSVDAGATDAPACEGASCVTLDNEEFLLFTHVITSILRLTHLCHDEHSDPKNWNQNLFYEDYAILLQTKYNHDSERECSFRERVLKSIARSVAKPAKQNSRSEEGSGQEGTTATALPWEVSSKHPGLQKIYASHLALLYTMHANGIAYPTFFSCFVTLLPNLSREQLAVAIQTMKSWRNQTRAGSFVTQRFKVNSLLRVLGKFFPTLDHGVGDEDEDFRVFSLQTVTESSNEPDADEGEPSNEEIKVRLYRMVVANKATLFTDIFAEPLFQSFLSTSRQELNKTISTELAEKTGDENDWHRQFIESDRAQFLKCLRAQQKVLNNAENDCKMDTASSEQAPSIISPSSTTTSKESVERSLPLWMTCEDDDVWSKTVLKDTIQETTMNNKEVLYDENTNLRSSSTGENPIGTEKKRNTKGLLILVVCLCTLFGITICVVLFLTVCMCCVRSRACNTNRPEPTAVHTLHDRLHKPGHYDPSYLDGAELPTIHVS